MKTIVWLFSLSFMAVAVVAGTTAATLTIRGVVHGNCAIGVAATSVSFNIMNDLESRSATNTLSFKCPANYSAAYVTVVALDSKPLAGATIHKSVREQIKYVLTTHGLINAHGWSINHKKVNNEIVENSQILSASNAITGKQGSVVLSVSPQINRSLSEEILPEKMYNSTVLITMNF